MNDVLPQDIKSWQHVERVLAEVVTSYGYEEIRLPILESTALFERSIGEVTDIVEKEMYTFADRNDESITLRPEGTAGCVRAVIEHGLAHQATPRLWYMGPMFRYERPQKGRYRQFYHFGVEAFGLPDSDIELELILMSARCWKLLGLQQGITLQLNSLGSFEERRQHRSELVAYFERHYDDLDEDSRRRLNTNPLRILDSKNPALQSCIEAAPKLIEYFGEASLKHLEKLGADLTQMNIRWQLNPRLVRGLDYYSHTVFEWVTNELGSQGTVCAGGRYNSLVEQLGGKPTAAVGFAIGLERLVLLYQQHILKQNVANQLKQISSAYLIHEGELAQAYACQLAEQIRDEHPNFRLMMHCGEGSFKSQFKKADKSGADIALVIGDDEAKQQTVSIKFLRRERPQEIVKRTELSYYLTQLLKEEV